MTAGGAESAAESLPAPRDPSGWLSYTSVTMHRTCTQRWAYRYLLGLKRIPDEGDAKPELNFGIWWHALRAADSIERGREKGSLLLEPKSIGLPEGAPDVPVSERTSLGQLQRDLRGAVMKAAGEWWGRIPEEHREQWAERLGGGDVSLSARLEALDARWREHHAEALAEEEPLAVEMRWEREVPGTGGRMIMGYIDEVYRDTRRNVVVIRDRKTSKDLGRDSSEDAMMDGQLHLYAWGAAPQLAEQGVKVQAVGYDRACSLAPTTPKLTQTGTLSKTVTRFDLRTYVEWCAEGQEYPGRAKDGSGAGLYELDPAVVERLSSPDERARWFRSSRVPLNRNLVRSHLQAAADTAKDADVTAQRFARRGEAARSPTPGNCKWCDYAKLCRAQMLGGPDGEYAPADFGLRGPRAR